MSHKKAHKAHKVYFEREPLINRFVLFVPYCGKK